MSAPFETEADRLAELTALGEDATYTPLGGVAKTIKVLYDHDVIRFDSGGVSLGERPEAEARTSDLTGTVAGGTLTVDGTTYVIKALKPDGNGMTTVKLSKKA